MVFRMPGVAAALLLASSFVAAQDLGRSIAANCANCHGTEGRSRGEVPSLAGAPAERTVALMAAYKAGSLAGTIMPQLAKGYSDEQIRLVAAYFAAVKP